MAVAEFDRGLRAAYAGGSLIAILLRLFQGLVAGEILRRQHGLAIKLELGAGHRGLSRRQLRLGLRDRGLLGLDLMSDPADG